MENKYSDGTLVCQGDVVLADGGRYVVVDPIHCVGFALVVHAENPTHFRRKVPIDMCRKQASDEAEKQLAADLLNRFKDSSYRGGSEEGEVNNEMRLTNGRKQGERESGVDVKGLPSPEDSDYGKNPLPGTITVPCKNRECSAAIRTGVVFNAEEWIAGFISKERVCPDCKIEAVYSRDDVEFVPLSAVISSLG